MGDVRGEAMTITDLSRRLGVTVDKVKREFKWWCYYRNKRPDEFFYPGIGYILPEEFITWFEETVVGREKR